jgi:hypothetical protein
MRIVSGRGFSAGDQIVGSRVVLLNETLARQRFPGQNAVGRQVYLSDVDPSPWQVAGIVADIRQSGPDREAGPQVFADLGSWPLYRDFLDVPDYFVVRTEGKLATLPAIRDAVRQLSREAMLDNVVTMEELVSGSIARPRMSALLLGIFAGVAAMVAAVGIYGVMAYAVTQSTREIGVRIALGARSRDVLALVLGRAGVLTAVGLTFGLAGAAAITRYLHGMIFGLARLDLATYVTVAGVFAGITMLASYVPARRATRVNPVIALRHE